jgi:hypothetical protein
MILIAHRGNIEGSNPERENDPEYIDEAIKLGYDVEIDLWSIEGVLLLGHDKPQYGTSQHWLNQRCNRLWVHCKNIEAIEWMNAVGSFTYFWHQEDTLTLTSHNHIWAYPGKQPIKGSIAVMPEIHNDNLSECIGVCSDYIEKFNNENNL